MNSHSTGYGVKEKIKIRSLSELYALLPAQERELLDLLCELVRRELPAYCREKISYNVPYFYGHKGICILWPASVPRGGFKRGVLFGFWRGNELIDEDQYLVHGTNKKIFYRIYQNPEEVDVKALRRLLREAVKLDARK